MQADDVIDVGDPALEAVLEGVPVRLDHLVESAQWVTTAASQDQGASGGVSGYRRLWTGLDPYSSIGCGARGNLNRCSWRRASGADGVGVGVSG